MKVNFTFPKITLNSLLDRLAGLKSMPIWAWGAILLTVFMLVRYANPYPVEILRLKGFDLALRTDQKVMSKDVVLVEITDASLKREGQWPWSREKMANLVKRLQDVGATQIGVAILMSEPDRAGTDATLAKVVGKNVALAQTVSDKVLDNVPVSRGVAKVGEDPLPWLVEYPGAIPPVKVLANNAAGVGMVNTPVELDGVTRRLPLLSRVEDQIYPALGVELIRQASGFPSYQVKTTQAGIEIVRMPPLATIRTDRNSQVWISWDKDFERIEATSKDLSKAAGKFVIIGVTAAGIAQPVGTPNGGAWPHDIQAQLLQTIIDGTAPVRPVYADLAELAFILAVGLVLVIFVPMLDVKKTGWAFGAIVFGTLALVNFLFRDKMLFDATWPLITFTLVYGLIVFLKFAEQWRLRQQIKKQFGTYLSPAMVEKLQENPNLLQLGGESRELSIMFTDVRGFTSISEHYGRDVQGLTKIMNRYMTAMTAKIIENDGTLDKYIGDAQMAFWNAPLDDPNHAKNAVRTALQMMGSLDAFNAEITKEGIPAFGMGLGINTDTVVVGNMGSDQRFDYTCLGDGVNLASRLEGQSKPYGVRIVLGPKTAEQIQDEYFTLELDCIAVKGKKEGVNIYTVLDLAAMMKLNTEVFSVNTEYNKYVAARDKHNGFLKLYRTQKWDDAVVEARALKKEFNGEMSGYYDAMIDRIKELKDAGLPKSWDGVYRAQTK